MKVKGQKTDRQTDRQEKKDRTKETNEIKDRVLSWLFILDRKYKLPSLDYILD